MTVVTVPNSAPIATDQNASTAEDTPVAIVLPASDVDPADVLSFVIVAQTASRGAQRNGTQRDVHTQRQLPRVRFVYLQGQRRRRRLERRNRTSMSPQSTMHRLRLRRRFRLRETLRPA